MQGPLRHYEFTYPEPVPGSLATKDATLVIAAHDAADALVQFNVLRPKAPPTRLRPMPAFDPLVPGCDSLGEKRLECIAGCCRYPRQPLDADAPARRELRRESPR